MKEEHLIFNLGDIVVHKLNIEKPAADTWLITEILEEEKMYIAKRFSGSSENSIQIGHIKFDSQNNFLLIRRTKIGAYERKKFHF